MRRREEDPFQVLAWQVQGMSYCSDVKQTGHYRYACRSCSDNLQSALPILPKLAQLAS